MKHKNKRTLSIRTKLAVYLVLFTTLLISSLAVFELVFLDDFYKMIKKNELYECTEIIESSIDQPESLSAICASLAHSYRSCILVFDGDGRQIGSAEILRDCYIHRQSKEELSALFAKAAKNGGTYTKEQSGGYINAPFASSEKTAAQSLVIAKIIYEEGSVSPRAFILLNSALSPMSETVSTLTVQLCFVGGIFIILAIVFSLLISKKIAKPIITLSEAAKNLPYVNADGLCKNEYSEILQLSQSLSTAAQESAKTEGLRRELLANITHDLRTPLTLIGGYAEMMRDLPGENNAENAQHIIDETQRLSTLVDDVVDLSKLNSDKAALSPEVYNITENLTEIIKRHEALMKKHGYSFEFLHKEELFVKADRQKIEQVVYNLLNNAAMYSEEDNTVRVVQSTETVNGVKYARIEIRNSGTIPKEILPQIWERYYRGSEAKKRRANGSGIGLSIVKSILTLHGVPFGAESDNGDTCFFFLLPLA